MILEQETDLMLVRDYIEKCDFETAIRICNYETNKEDIRFIIKKIYCLIELKKYNEAIEIASIYQEESLKVLSLKIKALIYLGKYEEALELVNLDKCKDSIVFVSQKVRILMELEKYGEALEIVSKNEYIDVGRLYLQKIHILEKINRIDEAIKLCDNKKYENNKLIKLKKQELLYKKEDFHKYILKKVRQLIEEKKYIEALNICKKYYYDDAIKDIIIEIYQYINLNDNRDKSVAMIEKEFVKNGLMQIYNNNIEYAKIKELNIDEFQKDILLLAYYDKFSCDILSAFIKDIKKKYIKDYEKTKKINFLLQNFSISKKRMFDIQKYANVLNVGILNIENNIKLK